MNEPNQSHNFKPDLHLLLLEDDDGDAKAFSRALQKTGVKHSFKRATDGAEALKFLENSDSVPSHLFPHIIVVDLNMPGMDGIKFIRTLRDDPHLNKSIIFVLSTSQHEYDVELAYELNVAGYILKSATHHDYQDLADMLVAYWKIVEPPHL